MSDGDSLIYLFLAAIVIYNLYYTIKASFGKNKYYNENTNGDGYTDTYYDEFDDDVYSYAEERSVHVKVVDRKRTVKNTGVDGNGETFNFSVTFEKDNGDTFTYNLSEEEYYGFDIGQMGILTFMDDMIYSFELDEK